MGEMISYAISIGEGTLLEYGTCDVSDLPMVDPEFDDRITIIMGPADGTGE